MKPHTTLCLLSLCLIIAGCAHSSHEPSYWTHPDKPFALIRADHHDCSKLALEKYPEDTPVLWVDEKVESGRKAQVDCSSYKNSTSCTFTPATPDRHFEGYRTKGKDKNLGPRLINYAKCMKAKDSKYICLQENEAVKKYYCSDGNIIQNKTLDPWVPVKSSEESNYYSIFIEKSLTSPIITALLLEEYSDLTKQRTQFPYKSTINTLEINCKNNTFRIINNAKYFSSMGEGNGSSPIKYFNEKFDDIELGSLVSILKNAACEPQS